MIYRDVSSPVIPAKAGIQRLSTLPKTLGPGLRRGDGNVVCMALVAMIYRDVSWLVIPAKAGIQRLSASPKTLGPGLRRGDGNVVCMAPGGDDLSRCFIARHPGAG
jgi:hypothetical protein